MEVKEIIKNKAEPKKLVKKVEKVITNDDVKNALIKSRDYVNAEMKRFGFEYNKVSDIIHTWTHTGYNHQSTITIRHEYNSLTLDHKYRKNKDSEWIQTEFGIMSPLWEVISMVREAYLISTDTRRFNDEWTKNDIIPGTNGDGN